MAGGYLGKISAVVAVNASSVAPTLNSAGKTVNDWARKTQSTINSAMNSAGRSIGGIYTPLQKLEKAIKQANRLPLELRAQNPRQILQAARAAEQIAKPLGAAQQGFTRLSQSVQSELRPVLEAAQKQSTQLFQALSNGAKVSETDIQNTAARVERLTAALTRAGEASKLVGQLSTGRELRFQNPEFVQQINRTAQLQQQAAGVPSNQLSSGIVDLIVKQRAAAEEAERLRAALDKIRTTQKGDASAAAVAYNAQIASLSRINDELEKQIGLTQKSQAVRDAEAAAAPLIRDQRAQRDADRVFQAENARLRRQAEEDNRAAARRASDLLNVDQLASNEGLMSRRATTLPPNYFQEGFARQIRDELGPAITDQRRQFDVLLGSIVSVKGQLDTLPAGVRSQFIPAIQQAEAEFKRLRALGPDATAEAIENASNEVDRLNQQLRRVSQVQALPNFAQALDDSAIRGSIGSLNALQQILSRVGAEAGSNAAVQFDRMRDAIQRATADGTIGSQAFQNELREIARDAAAAASATGQIGQDAAFREIQRGGDIARGGFDNLSLAVQQAAFAIDDFFSVQGDFSQRIRAVQNNVTQLAFILGGTTGLFIGLGVSIAAQAVVGLVKWINNGRTAEDQTKALNDALASQKSLVEELAQAFESLGDSITERAFSESTQQARAFAKQLEEIAKQQREIRENRVADLDTGVQRERANQARIQRELQSSSDPARRLVLESELASSRSRERDVRQAAINQRPLPFNQIRDIVLESVRAEANVRSLGRPDQQQVRRQQEAALENLGDGTSLERTLEGLRSRLTGLRNSPDANDRGIQQAAVGLERAIAVIESRLNSPLDELTRTVSAASRGLSIELEKAQGDVADAIRRGVPAAAEFQATLDATASELKSAFDRLSAAQEITDNPGRRESEIRAAQQEIARLQQAQDGLNRQARDIQLTSGAGGERTTAALSALQGSERFTNEYGRLIARLRDAVAREEQARTATAAAGQKNDQALLEKARAELMAATAASDLAAATAEAATAMEQAISRVRRIGDDALRGSEQIADDAQRRFAQDPTDANRQARDAAEQQLIRDRERIAQANNALDRARSEAERNDPRVAAVNAELESIAQERRRLSDEAAKRGGQVDAAEAERLANREAQLQAERATILDELTQAERRQQDTIAQEIAARLKVIEALEQERRVNDEIRQRERPQGDAVRGLDLLETDAQRSARELAQGLADIQAATSATIKRLREQFEADGVVTRDERDQLEAARRAGEDAQNRFRAANDPFLQEFRRLGLSPRFNETQRGDAVRGLGLSQTPAQRAAAEAEQGIRDIDAAFREIDRRLFERGAGVPELDANEAARQDAIRRFAADQQRAAAPAIFGLADSVANAVLQGPSRAALNVSDISTQEGARELNRLLRGEDSARDQNLIELQKQSTELAQVNTKLTALANRVGVAL